MKWPMRPTRLITIVALSVVIVGLVSVAVWFAKQARIPSDVAEVIRAVGEIAPEGGTGKKTYHYSSGAVKEVVHWQDFDVTQIDYYHPSGRRLYTAKYQNRSALLISLDEEGTISEIFETRNYVYDGAKFVFEKGMLSKIVRIESDEIVDEISIPLP